MSFGDRLRFHRERAGMSRTVLGELCGRSAEWVKAIERGRLLMPRMPLLLRLSEILQIDDLAKLTGEQKLNASTYTKHRHEKVAQVARALATYPLAAPDREPLAAGELAANVAQAWMVWHGSPHQRTAIATVLPRLLEDARAAVRQLDGNDRRRAQTSLAQIYHLAQLYLSFQPMPELVLLTGDRAMQAAQDADDPHAMAAAAWYLNHVFRDAGEQAEARIDLAHQATRLLRPEDSEQDRQLWGLQHLAMALSYAKTGRRGDAERHWDRADRAARSLDGHHPWLLFGRAMVDAYSVTMYADLTDGYEATRQADRLSLDMPSATRRSFHLIEMARAYHLKREPLAMVHLLGKAYKVSPDTISYNLFTRSAVQELMASGNRTVRDDARALARKLQLPSVA
ncbi:multiprotein-bridging factor 1 family protein [Sphaerisporangium sp. NPDC049003]|uniref:helix-turn-helix domain-containing protein n=1 Tax=Sphaerisporangium sp. NPDC049003 TaxID=3364517 RepID=UPI0037114007